MGEMMTKLTNSFFRRTDVVNLAQELIGKLLVTRFDGIRTSGRIVETEAYTGIIDRASHAYNGRRTGRTEPLYAEGGIAYVYLCYGIHHMFNVVTNRSGIPEVVLVRAIEPVHGIEEILRRTHKTKMDSSVGRGPGNVTRALGIKTADTGTPFGSLISIWKDDWVPSAIIATPRIGIDYAGEDAGLSYRFYLAGNPHVSGKKS